MPAIKGTILSVTLAIRVIPPATTRSTSTAITIPVTVGGKPRVSAF